MMRRRAGLMWVTVVGLVGILSLTACGSEKPDPHHEVASLMGYDLGGPTEYESSLWFDEPQPANVYWGYEAWKFARGDYSGFEPEVCRDLFLATVLLVPADEESTSDDPMAEIDAAWFPDTFVNLAMRAREFDSTEDASAFLETLPSLLDPCLNGFAVPDHYILPWEFPSAEVATLESTELGTISVVRMPSEAWGESVEQWERAEWLQWSYYFVAQDNLVIVLEGVTDQWGGLDSQALTLLEGAAAYMEAAEAPPLPVETPALDPEPTPFSEGGMVTVEQISGLELWLIDSEREEPWGEPVTAGEWFDQFGSGGECLDLRRAESLLTTSDDGSSDVIMSLGGFHVFELPDDEYYRGPQVWIEARARVFENPDAAEDFLTALVDSAQDCGGGFTEGDFSEDGYERSVAEIAIYSGQRPGGGDWVTIDLRNEELSYDDVIMVYEHHYLHYFRFSNVVVQLVNPVGFDTLVIPEEDLALLFDQIVSHLQAAGQ